MADTNSGKFDRIQSGGARSQAELVLERWRRQGFDAVTCYRSGYCCPANSSVFGRTLPEGYVLYAIDSEEALEAVAVSIAAGTSYRVA
jgi:hypothetical protein